MLLEFFYHETIHPTTDKTKLYEKIHQLYHKTSASNPYRRYLFYKNYSLTSKQKFRLNLYIQQYLSFNSMYICSDFCFHRKQQIISGIEKGNMEFFQFFEKKESKLEEEGGGDAYENLTRKAAIVPPGSDGLIFLPYLLHY